MRDFTWAQVFSVALGLLQWSIAIVSVAGTLTLFIWIVKMIVKKDKRDELH
jgi:hypothetical protein